MTITRENAANVLFVMDGPVAGAAQPGNFTSHLIKAISVADPSNRAALSGRFPGLVEAVTIYKDADGGTEHLTNVATGLSEWNKNFIEAINPTAAEGAS